MLGPELDRTLLPAVDLPNDLVTKEYMLHDC